MSIGKTFYAKASKQQEQEIVNRLNVIHQWAFNIYRSPMVFDAMPAFSTTDQVFASQHKIERTQYGISSSSTGGTPTTFLWLLGRICAYSCGRDNREIMRGAGCGPGTNISVTTNTLAPLFIGANLDDFYAEIMRVDNRPIKMMYVSRGIKMERL